MNTTSTALGLCAWMCVHGEGQREAEGGEGGEEGERHLQLGTGKDSRRGASCTRPGRCGRAEGVPGARGAVASHQRGREWTRGWKGGQRLDRGAQGAQFGPDSVGKGSPPGFEK